MKVRIEEKDKWLKKEKKKAKIRIITVSILVSIMLIAVGVSTFTRIYRDKNGLFYEELSLKDVKEGEPRVVPPTSDSALVKCIDLPYVLGVRGDLQKEDASGCLFDCGSYQISVSKVPDMADISLYMTSGLCAGIDSSITDGKAFKEEEGYLNGRKVKVFGETLYREGKAAYYSENILFYTGFNENLLICAFSDNKNIRELMNAATEAFYSVRELEETIEVTEKEIEDEEDGLKAADTETPGDFEDIKEGEDFVPVGSLPKFASPEFLTTGDECIYEAEEGEKGYICFMHTNGERLSEIVLSDPNGESFYYPDNILKSRGVYLYVFDIGDIKEGSWKIVFSAKTPIGIYNAGYIPYEVFDDVTAEYESAF